MEEVRETEKRYCSGAMTVAIIMGLFFILAGEKSVGKGLIFGTIFSVINFILMGETLHKRLGKSKGKTFFVSLGSIGFRYLLLAIPIIIAIKFEEFNLIASCIGIFMIQLIIMADHLFKVLYSTHKKQF